MSGKNPKIVIIGAGFGGLYAAKTLADKEVEVLLVDRQNFHTFTPLLYQVATCGLDPSEIAYPVRSIFYDRLNVNFMMGEVEKIDYHDRAVFIRTNGVVQTEHYDYLIVAAGSVTNYFGNADLETYSFGLKDLSDAVGLRNHILQLFEKAAWTEDAAIRDALTTMVVIGGGPTGLETAGALHELYNFVLKNEYRQAPDVEAKVYLVEATEQLLIPYPKQLQESALKQLESLGVKVILNNPLAQVSANQVILKDGQVLHTHTLIWAAGVKASALGVMLEVELQKGGRVPITPELEVIGREAIYVVGDMAYLEDKHGQPYPMLIPVAKQQGILAANNIVRQIAHQQPEAFQYNDRGIMATIGRRRAVAWIFNRIPLTGFIAWLAWLGLHLLWLLGFRNRLNVFVNWVWNYLTYDRSVRIILRPQRNPPDSKPE